MSKKKNINEELVSEEELKEDNKEENTPHESVQETEAQTREDDIENKYMRLMADFQNFRKRQDKEKADIYSYANEKIVKDLLGVIDNFERALEAFDQTSGQEKFREGMDLILKQLWEVLEKSGVKEIAAEGEHFDPNFHNAVMMESGTEHESGKITTVLQKGYILNGKVIRPSMVKVAE